MFCTIEDETGTANIVVWSSLLDRYRRAMLGSSLLLVTGRLQRSPEGIVHVIADRLDDRSAMMGRITDVRLPVCCATGDMKLLRSPGHPRQERVFPGPGTSTEGKSPRSRVQCVSPSVSKAVRMCAVRDTRKFSSTSNRTNANTTRTTSPNGSGNGKRPRMYETTPNTSRITIRRQQGDHV